MKIDEVRQVLIIGSGNMGQQIGFQCAVSGYDVMFYDVKEDVLDKAAERIGKLAKNYTSAGRLKDEDVPAVMHTLVGPFGIMDSIGLDTVWKITDYWANQLKDPQAMANAAFLKQYVDKGYLGVKTGKGFYTYPDPAFERPGFIEGDL